MPEEAEVLCVICQRSRTPSTCTRYDLTPEEQMALRVAGQANPPSIIYYCRPCFRLLSNQTTALEMMKGLVEANLRSSGVPDAESKAERFRMMLIAKSKTKKG